MEKALQAEAIGCIKALSSFYAEGLKFMQQEVRQKREKSSMMDGWVGKRVYIPVFGRLLRPSMKGEGKAEYSKAG